MKTSHGSALLCAGLCCAALLRCQGASPTASETPAAPTVARLAPQPSPSANSVAPGWSPSPSATEAAPPATSAAGGGTIRRTGPTTPGKVQCGAETATCDVATQVCCLDPQKALTTAACAPKPAGTEGAGPCIERQLPVTMFCDDSSDCPAGQGCCIQDLASGDVSAHVYECAPYPCNLSEVCIPGGTCSHAGFTCSDDGDLFFGDTCTRSEMTSRCAAGTCSGKAGMCCWNAKTKASRCVEAPEQCMPLDQDPDKIETVALGCTSQDDCGGYPCAMGPLGNPFPIFRCTSQWAAGDMGWTILCRNDADCPRYGGRKFKGCKRSPSLPGWTKRCDYEWTM